MEQTEPLLAPAPRTDPIEIPGRDPVPVTLLTGFLGAGKTTLLNRILTGDHGLRVGVLVNDFGDINIDAALVEGVEDNLISLANGCICCELRDDLVQSLESLLTGPREIDYVIVEASGVAEPSGIVLTFLDGRYERLFVLDGITCLVDAEGIFRYGDDDQLNMLKLRQIGFADLVVLNKTDLVGPEHIEVIRDWIGLHMKRVRIVEAAHGDVPMEILLGVGRFDRHTMVGDDGTSSDGPRFDRWSYRSNQPLSLESLEHMVKRQLPESVYRCKGIIHTTEDPTQRYSLQVVGRRTQITPIGEWEGKRASTEIVAIGQDMDEQRLNNLFDSCKT
jgi:G3E family GTPase